MPLWEPRRGLPLCSSDLGPLGWLLAARFRPADHRAGSQELACPILIMRKTAWCSDMAKVTRSEGGRVGLHSAPTSRSASCHYAAGPLFLLSSPHNKAGGGWEETVG